MKFQEILSVSALSLSLLTCSPTHEHRHVRRVRGNTKTSVIKTLSPEEIVLDEARKELNLPADATFEDIVLAYLETVENQNGRSGAALRLGKMLCWMVYQKLKAHRDQYSDALQSGSEGGQTIPPILSPEAEAMGWPSDIAQQDLFWEEHALSLGMSPYSLPDEILRRYIGLSDESNHVE